MSYNKKFKEFKLLISKRQKKGIDFAVQKCILNIFFFRGKNVLKAYVFERERQNKNQCYEPDK